MHALRPILLDAAASHRKGWVRYDPGAVAVVRHPVVAARLGVPELVVPPARQFPLVRATFDDLNKAVSTLSNSPRMESGQTLRQAFDEELRRYEAMVVEAQAAGRVEPDYGTYVVDAQKGELYLVAPERWHRLALVTSNSKLLSDPADALSWAELRRRLEGAVVGFTGVSVGGNVLEGWLREARPRRVKLADPDWVEVTNFNRGERMTIRHAAQSRAARFPPENPYDVPRVSKCEMAAYEMQLVDPYLEVDVYKDGLTRENLDAFIGGDGGAEPPLDVLVEEMDHLDLKILARERARYHRVDVLMLSDFGHTVHLLWNPFRDRPDAPLGYGCEDERLLVAQRAARTGDRAKVFELIACLCGEDFADEQLRRWIDGAGEQPTASLPQSGATAMGSGAVGGKEIAMRVLGYPMPPGNRVVYDLLRRGVKVG